MSEVTTPEQRDRAWRLVLADMQGEPEKSLRVINELFAKGDDALDELLTLNAILVGWVIKGLVAREGSQAEAMSYVEGAIAAGLDFDVD